MINENKLNDYLKKVYEETIDETKETKPSYVRDDDVLGYHTGKNKLAYDILVKISRGEFK